MKLIVLQSATFLEIALEKVTFVDLVFNIGNSELVS